MATSREFDVESLLLPTPAEPLSAPGLDRDSVQFAFRNALRGGDATGSSSGANKGRLAELDRLIELGRSYLAGRAKDLVVAAWMAEILTQRSGFAGLRDGLALMHGLIARFWDECYPRLDADGDPDLRARPLESLASDRFLLFSLRRLPLSDPQAASSPFCYHDLCKGPAGQAPPPTEAEITSGPIGEAISRSSRQFYERLASDVREASESALALEEVVKSRFQDPPNLSPIGGTLAAFRKLLDVILKVKRGQEPDVAASESRAAILQRAEPISDLGLPVTPVAEGAAPDYGRLVIEFVDQARALADDAERLKKNREEYEEHKDKMKELDEEYKQIVQRISIDRDYAALLSRRLSSARGGAATDSS